MKDIFKANQINYILRTYFPASRYEERMEEMIRYCHGTGIEYVMLFTDAQHMVWNQLTLDEAKKEAGNIRKAKERLNREGIRVGINSSYNMPMSRWDHRQHNDYDYWATKEDGVCDYSTPCLLDPKLDKYLESFYTILAKIGPDYIYVDDDHRYILLGKSSTWGCFCDLHLQKFGELTATTWTRKNLNKALLNDQYIRKEWIEFLGERLIEIGRIITTAVHTVNPEIEVGIMVPFIEALALMGHTINNVISTFKGTGKPLVRPCIGPYEDHDRRQIIPGLFHLELIGHLLGDNIQYTPEIETVPYTRFSKSMTVVRFHIVQGILNRMNNPAISLCGYVGNSPYFEPSFVDLLKNSKNYFEGVRKIAPERGSRKGIQFIWHFDSAKLAKRSIKKASDLYWPAVTCHDILGNMGFTYTYDESPVKFLAGESVQALSKKRISEILSGGVLLEVNAAQALIELGYEDLIGCEIGGNLIGFGSEECTSKEFCGLYVDTYIPLKNARLDSVFKLKLKAKAQQISHIIDHDLQKIAPGVVIFENKLGGKIAVLPYSIVGVEGDIRHLLCYQRQYILKQIFNWMSRGVLTLSVEDPTDFAIQVWDNGMRITTCMTNLSYDTASEVSIMIYANNLSPQKAFYVADNGNLELLRDKIEILSSDYGTRWKLKHNFSVFRPFVMVIYKGFKN